jgi:hypothetical protein
MISETRTAYLFHCRGDDHARANDSRHSQHRLLDLERMVEARLAWTDARDATPASIMSMARSRIRSTRVKSTGFVTRSQHEG